MDLESIPPPKDPLVTYRVLLIGLFAVVILIGLVMIAVSLAQHPKPTEPESVNVLALSSDQCVVCHRKSTAGIVEQYGHSSMAAAKVSCQSCHEVPADYPGAVAHEGTYVLNRPSAAKCGVCHTTELAQLNQSRHGLPAYVAYAGSKDLSQPCWPNTRPYPKAPMRRTNRVTPYTS